MAIKIAGTTVIDDSRNVCNICTVNATNVCGTAFVGGGAGLTGVEAPPTFICNIACAAISNGDPVTAYCSCGVCGVLASPSYCCGGNFCYGPYGLRNSLDAVLVKFLCSDNCFAVVQFRSASFTGSSTYMGSYQCQGCLRVQAVCVSPGGNLSTPTDVMHCCYSACYGTGLTSCIVCNDTCAYYSLRRKMIPIPSCSGSKSTVLMCIEACSNGSGRPCYELMERQELKLCFCTTTSTISVVSYCCSCTLTSDNGERNSCFLTHYITPDRNYFVTILNCCCRKSSACGDVAIDVKTMTDSSCYLSFSQASVVCGCGIGIINNCGACSITEFDTPTPAIHPFAHGTDGWTFLYLRTFCNSANPYCPCTAHAAMAWRPVGNGQIETSCNIIRGSCTSCLPLWFCNNSCGNPADTGGVRSIARIFDNGDGIKKMIMSHVSQDTGGGPCSMVCLSCWTICAGNLLCPTGNGSTGYCLQSSGYRGPYICNHNCLCGEGPNGFLYWASHPICCTTQCYIGFVRVDSGVCMSCGSGTSFAFLGSSQGMAVCGFPYRVCNNEACPITWAACEGGWVPNRLGSGTYSAQRVACGCCLAQSCPGTYNAYPAPFHNCTIFVVATNGLGGPQATQPSNCAGYNYVLVYRNDNLNTTCDFFGIAQNDASVGQIVCVSVPGMIDTSCMMSRFFPTCPNPGCIRIGCCSNQVTAESLTLLGAGFYGVFSNYAPGFIHYTRRYDAKYGRVISQSGFKTCC